MNNPLELFLHRLRFDLNQPLPGQAAQLQMAPYPRPLDSAADDQPRPDTRRGGVLVLFYPQHERIFLPLILRPMYNGVHSGQVGFPGGGREAGDNDLSATALREAYEEIGVSPNAVTVLGSLSPLYVFASNYLVFPTVAWAQQRPNFRIDPYEVAQLLEVPLEDLLNEQNRRTETWQLRGRVANVPFFDIHGQKIWGATAMMLSELLTVPAIRALGAPAPGVQPPVVSIGDLENQD
jgi:8-oxo-dGTP pyrophosphatase MutT (NUDIX family)